MKPVMFLLMLVLLVSSVTAATTYPNLGFQDYVQGQGIFNANLDSFSSTSAVIDTPIFAPLVDDLDGDGRNEIVVLNGQTLSLYQNTTLQALTGVTVAADPSNNSNIIIFDVDADGLKDVIVANPITGLIYFNEFNGTSFTQTTVALSAPELTTHESLIGCSETQKCLYLNSDGAGTGGKHVLALPFNSTSVGLVRRVLTSTSGSAGNIFCLPQIKAMEVKDINQDGTLDYISSWLDVAYTGSNAERARMVYLSINATTFNTTILGTVDQGGLGDRSQSVGTPARCSATLGATGFVISATQDLPSKFISPPLVFDADTLSPGLEAMIGIEVAANGYEIDMYSSTGTQIDEFPDDATLNNVAGNMLSNVFRADGLAEDSRKDFCIIGSNPAGSPGSGGLSEINVLCGSRASGHTADCATGQCQHAEFDGQLGFNISRTYGAQHILAHAAQMTQATTTSGGNLLDNDDLDEIVSAYGILQLSYGDDNTVETIFPAGIGSAAIIAVDVMFTGLTDLIGLSATNLWYINDGFENTGAKITSVTYNPCIDSVIMQNSTVQIQFTVQDEQTDANQENDQVSGRIIGYAGEANEQATNFSTNSSAGTTFTMSFIANQTTGSSDVQVIGRDTGNPTTLDIITRQFTVSTSGASFGDSSCTDEFPLEGADEEPDGNETLLPSDDNVVDNFLDTANEATGLGKTVIWIIFMIVLAGALWMAGHKTEIDHKIALGLIFFVEVLMVILGVLFGYIGIGIIIVIVISGIGLIALLFLRPLLFGGSNGG